MYVLTIIDREDAKVLVVDSLKVLDPRAKDVVVHLCVSKDKPPSVSIQHDDVHALERDLPGGVSSSSLGWDFLCLEGTNPVSSPSITLHDHTPSTGNEDGADGDGWVIPLIGEHGSG